MFGKDRKLLEKEIRTTHLETWTLHCSEGFKYLNAFSQAARAVRELLLRFFLVELETGKLTR